MARPRKYASAAERQAAYRDRWAILETRIPRKTMDTIERLAAARGTSKAQFTYNLIMRALTGWTWYKADGSYAEPIYWDLPTEGGTSLGARRGAPELPDAPPVSDIEPLDNPADWTPANVPDYLSGEAIVRIMRRAGWTIPGLAASMGVSQARIRQVRERGINGRVFVLDYLLALGGPDAR